jgi:putative SOS response-associated peptidase YedK
MRRSLTVHAGVMIVEPDVHDESKRAGESDRFPYPPQGGCPARNPADKVDTAFAFRRCPPPANAFPPRLCRGVFLCPAHCRTTATSMCNQYSPPDPQRLSHYFDVPAPAQAYKPGLGPWSLGPFVRLSAGNRNSREAVVGQWALIADGAKEAKSKARIMTNNARSESIAMRSSFKGPWARGQRCLIPAESFLEPNWESGKNEWWRFARADGSPWALAGLWNTWTDTATGEVIESYTMLTMNADAHPLMRRMHKPDPDLPINQQDKRSVVVIERADEGQWLNGGEADARALIRLAPVEVFRAGPDRPPAAPTKPAGTLL